MPPANWATGAWCSLQASILPPPTYQIGALPNELRERSGALTWTLNQAPRLTRAEHHRNALRAMVLAGGIKPPASALRERRSID